MVGPVGLAPMPISAKRMLTMELPSSSLYEFSLRFLKVELRVPPVTPLVGAHLAVLDDVRVL